MSRGVLLMAYGTPEGPAEVAPYYTHIRGGRAPGAESVARLQRRYEIVGGRTPLLALTNAVRDALAKALSAGGEHVRVYAGMKHWHPFIGDVIPAIAADGVTELTAVALAPHYSRISIGGYQQAVSAAVAAHAPALRVRFVDQWHMNAAFLDLMASRVLAALAEWPAAERERVTTVFSAHSLPQRIREWNDPYERQLLDSCAAVAARAGIVGWRFAWQSAGATGEPWLGPDICDEIEALHATGVRHVLSVPIGFVSDHLEILYDLDHEARATSASLGVTWRRTAMPNDDPAFVRVLASVVRDAESAPSPAARAGAPAGAG